MNNQLEMNLSEEKSPTMLQAEKIQKIRQEENIPVTQPVIEGEHGEWLTIDRNGTYISLTEWKEKNQKNTA